VLMLVVYFCIEVDSGIPDEVTAEWLHSLIAWCTNEKHSLSVDVCHCMIDRIRRYMKLEKFRSFVTGWHTLADSRTDIPHLALVTSLKACTWCGRELKSEPVSSRQSSDAMMYSSIKGPQKLKWFKKSCPNCDRNFYDGWCSTATGKTGMRGSLFHDIGVVLTGETVFSSTPFTSFDVAFLVNCDMDFLYNYASFNGLANAYNGSHRRLITAEGRHTFVDHLDGDDGRWLCYKRLGDAWFKWTLTKFLRQYNLGLDKYDLSVGGSELDAVLLEVLPLYQDAFESEFAKHQCDLLGCSDCWIMDGHLKNRRFICATTNINFMAAEGFPNGGYFQGCKNRPWKSSRHCANCLKKTATGGPVSGKKNELYDVF
jgi:hypothetical protein